MFRKSSPGATCRCLPPVIKAREVLESTGKSAGAVSQCLPLRREILADCSDWIINKLKQKL